MSKQTTIKIVSIVLLAAITALIAFTMDVAFWVDTHLTSAKFFDNRETIHVSKYIYGVDPDSSVGTHIAQYEYGKTPPIAFGEIKNPENAYFHIKLRFRAESTEGYPNVFQTAPINRGMRMEISGSTAAIIIRDLAEPGGLRGLSMTTALNTGQWYALEVEALNGAFVRILLDGKLVNSYYGAGLFIETSQLLVGAGFDASRAFRGQMDNISVMKGNLNLPHQGLKIVYATIVAISALFIYYLWKALSEHRAVQKVIAKLALLALPLVLILSYSEYRLSFLNTNYYTKRVALEQQLDDVEVLVVGSSNTVYGVAPEVFTHRGFNLSFLGNGMFYDARLVEKYSEKIQHLRLVLLTANYFTIGMDYSTFSQSWRAFFLRQNYNIPIKYTAGLLCDFGFWLNPINFSKIALYGDQAIGYIGAKHFTPVDFITTPTGWFDSGDVSGDEHTKEIGINAAEAHNASINEKNIDRNLGYWEALIASLQRKNITAVIVMLPTDVSYHGHLDKVKTEFMYQRLMEFALRHHIKFVNYTSDARFSLDDFTLEMPDHMNARGAIKFSKILDDEVIKAQW